MPVDATEQARMVRGGEVSQVELVEEAIRSLEELNPRLNAVTHPLLDEARATAAGELPDGPFRGVPISSRISVARWPARRCPRG